MPLLIAVSIGFISVFRYVLYSMLLFLFFKNANKKCFMTIKPRRLSKWDTPTAEGVYDCSLI